MMAASKCEHTAPIPPAPSWTGHAVTRGASRRGAGESVVGCATSTAFPSGSSHPRAPKPAECPSGREPRVGLALVLAATEAGSVVLSFQAEASKVRALELIRGRVTVTAADSADFDRQGARRVNRAFVGELGDRPAVWRSADPEARRRAQRVTPSTCSSGLVRHRARDGRGRTRQRDHAGEPVGRHFRELGQRRPCRVDVSS